MQLYSFVCDKTLQCDILRHVGARRGTQEGWHMCGTHHVRWHDGLCCRCISGKANLRRIIAKITSTFFSIFGLLWLDVVDGDSKFCNLFAMLFENHIKSV
jgi:hypothetical protein